ncbi:MAG TPA: aldehyde dehydrogenase family protein, partial [Bacteroidetes bacterium]|nr:aldehyde dehydrogenase family protein [Bacteroidota bacterium]
EGRIFHPTVLIDVRPEMDVVCNEVFAPVVSLIPVQDFEQGISLLDDSQYGLQAGIFTRDIHHAFMAIKTLNVGGVMINDVPTYRADHMPYGGNKNSGIGREGARFAIEEMTNIKFVCFNL